MSEEQSPPTNDLARAVSTFALEPFPTGRIGDAPEPEGKRRTWVAHDRRGVRESHTPLVAAPSGFAEPSTYAAKARPLIVVPTRTPAMLGGEPNNENCPDERASKAKPRPN